MLHGLNSKNNSKPWGNDIDSEYSIISIVVSFLTTYKENNHWFTTCLGHSFLIISKKFFIKICLVVRHACNLEMIHEIQVLEKFKVNY